MATTTHLGLTKPLGTDKVSVEVLNKNWDALDAAVFDRALAVARTVALPVADWLAEDGTQVVAVEGLGAADTVIVSPAPEYWSAYIAAGVRCTAQAAGTLTFACDTAPAEALAANVLILKGVAE